MNDSKRILLTGGTGMVGKNVLDQSDVYGWKMYAPSSTELDLTNFNSTENYLNAIEPDIVIHAAGMVGGIQANIENPVNFLVKNTDIGRNVVLASRNAGIKRLINLGSSCMYPRNAVNPLTEDLILTGELEPTNEGYALAKIFTLKLCQYISRESPDFQYKTLIPCNLYGKYDKFSPHNSHLIPAIISKIHDAKLKDLNTVEIWGDGKSRREFMYAGDLVKMLIKAVKEFDSLPEIMNVGLGYDYSINEYYQSVATVIGWGGEFVHDLSKPVGMKQKLVNIEKQNLLGWVPSVSLEEGISLTYDYYMTVVKHDF